MFSLTVLSTATENVMGTQKLIDEHLNNLWTEESLFRPRPRPIMAIF